MDTKENIPQQNYTFINATLNLAHHQPQVKYNFATVTNVTFGTEDEILSVCNVY